jgi:cytochrome c biogenesis factor
MKESKDLVNSSNIMFATVLTMLFLAALITFGMLTPLLVRLTSGVEMSMSAEYFNNRSALPTAALVILLTMCLLYGYFGAKRTLFVGAFTMAISISFAFLSPFGNLPLDVTVPVVSMALVATFYKIYMSTKRDSRMMKLRGVSAHVIHLGIILILIGIVASSNMKVDGSAVVSMDSPG